MGLPHDASRMLSVAYEETMTAVANSAVAPTAASAPAMADSAAAPVLQVESGLPLAELPTQEGPKGLRFDFNDGCRLVLPESADLWHVRLSDLDTGNILYE